jgi:two-component system, OmpR family, sensor kinase
VTTPAPPPPAAVRLRRLRWWLTGLLVAVNTPALLIFAWLTIRADAAQEREQLDGDLRRVTLAALQLVTVDENDGLDLSRLGQAEISRDCPQFVVLPVGDTPFLGIQSQADCADVDLATLNRAAVGAVTSGRLTAGYVTAGDGHVVRMLAEPFQAPNGYTGAVVATTDAQESVDRHDLMATLVGGGAAVLLVGLALASHVISGRAIRPAATALEQQEALLAETAHDLRTPIAALRALAETALAAPDQRADLLPRTVRLAHRMGGIIDSLLARARLAAGMERLDIQPVRLDQLVAAVVEETPADGAQVSMTAAPSTVLADPGLIQRAVGNLLDNALRHGRRPGRPALVHITVVEGRTIVADNGPGIDASFEDTMADRFVSGAGSTGLGLSVVRWIAEAHGGSLAVHNAPDGGAIFELTLRAATFR